MEPNTQPQLKKGVLVLGLVALIIIGAAVYTQMGKIKGTTPTNTVPELSQEERVKNVKVVLDKAQTANSIDISACKPYPETTQFKLGSTVEFVNKDSIEHKIMFSPEHNFVVPAKGKFKIVFNFYKFPGVRNYTCDNKPAGQIVVIK